MNLENALQIDGWMSYPELEILAGLAKKSSSIIEVGCYKGRTTRVLADNTEGIVYCLDPLEGTYFQDNGQPLFTHLNTYETFCNNLSGPIKSGKVILYRKESKYLGELYFLKPDF